MRTLPSRALLLTLGVASIHVACGEDDENEQRAKQAMEREQAAQNEFANFYCGLVGDCCNRILELPADVEPCKKRLFETDPVTVKDEKARTDCVEQLKANRLRFDFCSDFGNMEIPSCPDAHRKELTGTKKVGETCTANSECAPAFDGVVSCKGVCQVVRRGKEGVGPCISTMDGSVERRINDVKDAEAVNCHTRDGLICDPGSKNCVTPFPEKRPCLDTRQCAPGLFCETRERQCFKRIDSGDSCTQIDECKGYCKDATAEEFGTCVAPSAKGASCTAQIPCEDGLACTGGKCSDPPPDARLAAACGGPK